MNRIQSFEKACKAVEDAERWMDIIEERLKEL